MGNTLSDVMTSSSTHQQPSQVGNRLIDRETNTSEVELRTQREETRIDVLGSNNRDIQMPTSHSGISSHETEIIGGSPIRPFTRDMIPQLDGPTSVHTRVRTEQDTIQRSTVIPRGGYPNESNSDSHDNRRPHNGRRPSGRRRYQERSGRPPDRGNSHDRGYSRRGRPPDGNRGPPDDEGSPDDGGPPNDGGHPDDGGPPRNGRNPRCPGR